MNPSSGRTDGVSGPPGILGSALAWARARGLVPQPTVGRKPWEGALVFGWLNWAMAITCLLIAATLVWHVGWSIAGGGSGPEAGSGVAGGEQGEIPAGSGGSSGETQPGDQGFEPDGEVAAEGQETQHSGTDAAQGRQVAPFPDYNAKLRQDLFGVDYGSEPAPEAPAAGPQPADLRLQGVILGQPPQAIIYDSRGGTTYWVTLGESIGEITVEEILENTVKVSFKGESLDLKL